MICSVVQFPWRKSMFPEATVREAGEGCAQLAPVSPCTPAPAGERRQSFDR